MLISTTLVLPVTDYKTALNKVQDFRDLVDERWKFDLTLKDLNEKQGHAPEKIPITSDVIKFREYSLKVGEASYVKLSENPIDETAYKKLNDISLALTILQNKKRVGDVQYTRLEYYERNMTRVNQEESLQTLSEPEKVLSSQFKRITTIGKGGKIVPILFFKVVQRYLPLLLSVGTSQFHSKRKSASVRKSTL